MITLILIYIQIRMGFCGTSAKVVMSDIAAELLASQAALDPTLRARVMRLANLSLDHAENMMLHGDPKTKSLIANTLLKAMTQEIKRSETNDEIETLKIALAALTDAVIGYVPEILEIEAGDDDEVEVDSPRQE